MIFIPYERLTIKTYLRPNDALEKLKHIIGKRKYWSYRRENGRKPYSGSIDGLNFTVSRNIYYKNSFLPIIKGKVESDMGGCVIKLTMAPHILVIVFMLIWMIMVGFISLPLLFDTNIPVTEVRGSIFSARFFSFAMLFFAYALTLGAFKFESVKAKKDLKELFEAREVDEFSLLNLFNPNREIR